MASGASVAPALAAHAVGRRGWFIGAACLAALAALGVAIAIWPGDARSASPQVPPPSTYSVLDGGGTTFAPPEGQAIALDVKAGTARLAYRTARGSFFVHQNTAGETCLSLMDDGAPGAGGCGPSDSLTAAHPWVIEASGAGTEPITFGLVPDTITTVTTPDGRTAEVTNNVFSFGGDIPEAITMSGPNGSWTVRTRPSQ